MKIEKEIGDGNDYVYVYYNPNDKKLALLEGKDRWECKIGFSSSDPVQRIQDQGIQTSISREPIIGLLVRTPNGYYTEALLHKRLYQYKVISDGCGDEWFMTSPIEIEDILVNDILPKSKDLVKYCEYEINSEHKLGETLNLHRKKINLTNEKLSDTISVSRDTLWRFLSDDTTVCVNTMMKVLDTLGLDITLKSRLPSSQLEIHKSLRKAR